MSKTLNEGESWSPEGWDYLGGIKRQAQSLIKDPDSARVRGLSYKILSDPIYIRGKTYKTHKISIDAWEYTIHNDSREFPVLSVKILDRFDPSLPEEFFVSDIKAMACSVSLNEKTARRVLRLTRFLLGQVAKGNVPDTQRSLRMYRLHPVNLRVQQEIEKTVGSFSFKDRYDVKTGRFNS